RAALERNIQLREAEQKRRQQIRQESAGKKRKPAEKRDGRWPPGGQRSRSDVGSSGSENEWASRGGSKRSSRTPSPGFHGLITLPAPPSAAPGGAAASAAETCDDEDGKAPPSRPSSGMVTIGRGSPRSDKRRQLFHSALDEGDGDETGEEDDLDRAIIHSARGDSPPAVLTHPVGFEAESPRPRIRSVFRPVVLKHVDIPPFFSGKEPSGIAPEQGIYRKQEKHRYGTAPWQVRPRDVGSILLTRFRCSTKSRRCCEKLAKLKWCNGSIENGEW
ncbi:MAG: hypothetical protein BJ554DRAFT_4516, partial [Olpidium bornovanus]